ncbi:AP2 domain protein [compost metagenome]
MKNKYEIRGDVTAIFASSKKYGEHIFLIDTDCLNEVMDVVSKWHVWISKDGKHIYAQGKTKESNYKKWILLHRLVAKAPANKVVDHINHNTLDNRYSNLRLVTNAENQQNRRGASRHNRSSRIRGVSWHKRMGKWRVYVQVSGVQHHIGFFSDIEEAKLAAIEARKKLLPYSTEVI